MASGIMNIWNFFQLGSTSLMLKICLERTAKNLARLSQFLWNEPNEPHLKFFEYRKILNKLIRFGKIRLIR